MLALTMNLFHEIYRSQVKFFIFAIDLQGN